MKKGLRTIATIAALGVGTAGLVGYKAHSVRKDIIAHTNALLYSEGISIRPGSQCDILIKENKLRVLCRTDKDEMSHIILPTTIGISGLGAEEVESNAGGYLNPDTGILLIEGNTNPPKRQTGISI